MLFRLILLFALYMDIFIISVSVISFLLALRFRKVIYLFLLKKIYGKFSFKYIMKFKSYTRKNPHPYCFKDDFYYHILALNNARNCKKKYTTDKEFTWDDFNFTRELPELLKEKGNPDCFTISNEKNIPLKVAGYKSRMFHSNEKTLFYFCNNNCFMGEYVFSSLADDTSQQIIEAIQTELEVKVDYAKNFTIVDNVGNHLFFTDTGFFLSLKFFNIHNKTVKSIIEFTEQTEESKKNVQSTFGGLSC